MEPAGVTATHAKPVATDAPPFLSNRVLMIYDHLSVFAHGVLHLA